MEQEDNVGDRRKALLEEAFLLVSNPGGEGPSKQLGQITNNRKFQARKKSFCCLEHRSLRKFTTIQFWPKIYNCFQVFSALEAGGGLGADCKQP